MSNQLLMDNYLMILKSTIEVYVHGTLESSNESSRDILKSGLEETLKHQERVYNKMVDNEWYIVDNINPSCISDTLNNLN